MAGAALVQCTFYGNSAPYGGNVSSDCGALLQLSNCIVASSTNGVGFHVDGSSSAILACTDIHGNAGGDWVGAIADLLGEDGNICANPRFCEPAAGDFTLAADSPCLPEANPDCGLIGAHGLGCDFPLAVPTVFASGVRLEPNHPNPFNPRTTITFSLDRSQRTEVAVFDLTGKRIALLASRTHGAGVHTVEWNGRNSQGRDMAAGIYIVRMETESGVIGQKIALVR